MTLGGNDIMNINTKFNMSDKVVAIKITEQNKIELSLGQIESLIIDTDGSIKYKLIGSNSNYNENSLVAYENKEELLHKICEYITEIETPKPYNFGGFFTKNMPANSPLAGLDFEGTSTIADENYMNE
jgi:hypothetical protein